MSTRIKKLLPAAAAVLCAALLIGIFAARAKVERPSAPEIIEEEPLTAPVVTPTPAPTPEPTPEPTPPIPVEADGSFTVYGRRLNVNDEIVNLSHMEIADDGAAIAEMLPFMPNLKILDMDSCGVDSEHMAKIRDANPDVEVIWRIWFGSEKAYSVRTDVERILASNSGPGTPGGTFSREDCKELGYCTKVKLLDVGHTNSIADISFVANMPDLEVAILAMAVWCDATPLASCSKLEYAELQTTGLSDLTPLKECKNLKHLNICHDFAIHDITALYDLDLTRLWIGPYDPIPAEQIAQYQKLHPACKINTTALDPTYEGWRTFYDETAGADVYDPRYALLRTQFAYGEGGDLLHGSYSFSWNDPYYNVPKEY